MPPTPSPQPSLKTANLPLKYLFTGPTELLQQFLLCKTNSCCPLTLALLSNQIPPPSFSLKIGVTLPISWYWHCRAGLVNPITATKKTPGTKKLRKKHLWLVKFFPSPNFWNAGGMSFQGHLWMQSLVQTGLHCKAKEKDRNKRSKAPVCMLSGFFPLLYQRAWH